MIEELKEFLGNLTVVQACKLARDLEDAWGVKRPGTRLDVDARVVMAYGAPMPPGYSDNGVEYKFYLTNIGPNHIYAMKILRAHLGWDLVRLKTELAKPKVLLMVADDYPSLQSAKALVKELKDIGAIAIEER